ncbi:MAG: MarR family transcriptional regulator [Gemmatimonadales bacterium]|nr:MAG: MarR family transcriptional regulator [Gemmatimonadales bacterium]
MRPAAAMGIADSLEEEVLIALVQAAAVAATRSNAVAMEAGLSPSQYNVLRILRTAGGAGLTCTEIGSRMVTRDSDLTRLLGGLTDKQLVTRSRSPEDGRRSINRLTARGLRLLEQLEPRVMEAARTSFARMSHEDLRGLLRLLAAVLTEPAESSDSMGTRAASIT